MSVKTFYLSPTKPSSHRLTNLDRLTGWKKQIVTSILDEGNDDEYLLNLMSQIIYTERQVPPPSVNKFDDVVSILPTVSRTNAKEFLTLILKSVTLDNDDNVIFPNGVVGASIVDYLHYFFTPDSVKICSPPELNLMMRLMKGTQIISTFVRPISSSWLKIDNRLIN